MQQRRLSRIIQTQEQELRMFIQETQRCERIPDYIEARTQKTSVFSYTYHRNEATDSRIPLFPLGAGIVRRGRG